MTNPPEFIENGRSCHGKASSPRSSSGVTKVGTYKPSIPLILRICPNLLALASKCIYCDCPERAKGVVKPLRPFRACLLGDWLPGVALRSTPGYHISPLRGLRSKLICLALLFQLFSRGGKANSNILQS